MRESSFTILHSLTPNEAVRKLNAVVFQEVQRELGDNMSDLRQEWNGRARMGTFQFQAMGKPVTVRVFLFDGRVKFDLETVQEMGVYLPRIEAEICRQAEILLA